MKVEVNLATRSDLGNFNRRDPAAIRIYVGDVAIRRRLTRTFRHALSNGSRISRKRASVTRRNKIHRITLRAQCKRFKARIFRCNVNRARVSLKILGVCQVRLIERNAQARLANFSFLLRVFRQRVLPGIAIRICRGNVSALRNVGSNYRVIMVKGLNHMFFALRTWFFNRGAISRASPIVDKVNRVVYVMVAHYPARLNYGKTDLRRVRLAFRAMGGRRRFLSRANQ